MSEQTFLFQEGDGVPPDRQGRRRVGGLVRQDNSMDRPHVSWLLIFPGNRPSIRELQPFKEYYASRLDGTQEKFVLAFVDKENHYGFYRTEEGQEKASKDSRRKQKRISR